VKAAQVSTVAQPSSLEKRSIQALLRWRWLVLAVSLLLILLIELAEGHWWDVHVWIEVLLFGIVVPFTTWLLLTLLARNIARRAEIERSLERHRRLTQQLAQYQDWHELTRFVASFPHTVLPVERSSLFIYNHRKARLELVTEWQTPRAPAAPAAQWPGACKACLISSSPELRRVVECTRAQDANNHARADDYCLPLSYRRVTVGFLRLLLESGCTPTQDQVEFIHAAAPEIALALALSIAQPRQMARARVEAQQDERRRIAWELHNSLAQQIGFLHLGLDRLAHVNGFAANESGRRELEHMREVANEAYEQIRNNLAILRSWEQADLVQAIAEHAQKIANRTHLKIDLRSEGESLLLPPQACQRVFSLVQEGLTNVERHARAQRAQIHLDWSDDRLSIDMADDGVGFDPTAVPEGHFGLAMMRERAETLGGEFVVDSSHDGGTRLTFKIPLSRLEAGPAGSGRRVYRAA
jgi:signal transduction histidine kinase